MKRIRIILIAALALMLGSCAPDPRKQAEADATRLEAEAQAARAEQDRAQDEEIHALDVQDRQARTAAFQTFVNKVITTATTFAQFVGAMWVLSLGVFGVWVMFATTKAYSTYAERRAEVLGDIIKVDPVTGMYPAMMIRTGKNMVAIVNPNDNTVLFFDETHEADRLKVQAMANVLWAGTLGRNARLSHKPGEVAAIEAPQIIDGDPQ